MVSPDYDYTFKLTFHAEWFDPRAHQKKNFLMSFYPCDNTVELFDTDTKRMYLRRAAYEGLRLKDVFVGNLIAVYGRQIKITDYADNLTLKFVGKWKERTFAVIKPSGMSRFGEIIDDIYANNFTIEKMRMARLNRKETVELYDANISDVFLPFIIEHLCSAPVVAMELVGENSVDRWKELIGVRDPVEARNLTPNSLRARYGSDLATNAIHGAETREEALKNSCYFFPQGARKALPAPLKLQNSTCCVIKPHAISDGKLGRIIKFITENNFKITALQMFYLNSLNAEEFLEVYKGVVADFQALLHSFLDGPCVALEISGDESVDVHREFRRLCGPADGDIARQIRPRTIRGIFGEDKHKNAVHCTDLPEDVNIELEFLFKILED